jgi:hypothetical protein
MPHFSEEQLKELESLYELKSKETREVFDGVVTRGAMVWWKGEDGPEHVSTSGHSHWNNLRNFPKLYSISKPATKLVYVDLE